MRWNWRRIASLSLGGALVVLWGAGCGERHYTMEDFSRVEKIDAHVHINSTDSAFVAIARDDSFRLLTINTDYTDFPPVEEQWRVGRELVREYGDRVAFASTFRMSGWDEPGWEKGATARLESTFADGAIAVKLWKNIGMEFRGKDSALVMIDDSRLDPVIEYIRARGKSVIGHQGEPRDCWSPVEEMRVVDLKEYYGAHPQFHMYQHPEMPSYEAQIAARDRMLEKHRDLVFQGAHLASLEWEVDTLARFLDRFPRAVVDLAARMSQVQYQSARDRERVRRFFIAYQDRILYSTDIIQEPKGDRAALQNAIHAQWLSDWKYLCTDSTLTVRDLDRSFQGLQLPREVVEKIYRVNAERTYPGAWRRPG